MEVGIWDEPVLERGSLFRVSVIWKFDCIENVRYIENQYLSTLWKFLNGDLK